MAASSSSSKIEEMPPQHQVFFNFRGEDINFRFVSHLIKALEDNNINVITDNYENRGQRLKTLLRKIEKSRIALAIFSMKYTQSKWCLSELAKIKDCVEKGQLVAIPIFYKIDPSTVKNLRGQFGDAFWDLWEPDVTKKEEWEKALNWIPSVFGFTVPDKSSESEIINEIVMEVKNALKNVPLDDASENIDSQTSSRGEKDKTLGIKRRLNEFKDKLDLKKIASQMGMILGCLLVLYFAYMSNNIIGQGTDNPRNKYTKSHTGIYQAKPESSSSDAKANVHFLDRTFTNSRMDCEVKPPETQVFINFRGDQLRNNFVGYLVDALRKSEINVFIDNHAERGKDLNTLFKRINDSGLAIVVFSSRYTESKWCLEELVKIKERVDQGLLKVLPIFYKVTPTNVKRLKGEFGDHFRDKEFMYESDEPTIKRWKEAILFVSHKFALTFDEKSVLEIDFVETIVKKVLKMLQAISKGGK